MDLTQTMSAQTPIRNVVIYGNSPKFITIIKALFPKANTTLLPWRTSESEAAMTLVKSPIPADLLVICGYDYGSYDEPNNLYLDHNVYRILAVCKMITNDATRIIYINTLSTNKAWTYSRYFYAKKLLGQELKIAFPQTQALPIPTVFDQQRQTGMQGGMLSKFAAKALIHLGIIRTIDLEQLQDHIEDAIHNPGNRLDSSTMIRPILINIPRSQLIDRALRILLG
jgi:hypothetical protein